MDKESDDVSEASDTPDLLISVATEVEAAVIANELQRCGIEAVAAGGYTSGFKAEAPGAVQIYVKHVDADLARRTLDRIRNENADIDWSQVDVGEAE